MFLVLSLVAHISEEDIRFLSACRANHARNRMSLDLSQATYAAEKTSDFSAPEAEAVTGSISIAVPKTTASKLTFLTLQPLPPAESITVSVAAGPRTGL